VIEPPPLLASLTDPSNESSARLRRSTKGYEDPRSIPPAMPLALTPRLAAIYASSPEITVTHSPAGRETLAAINEELVFDEQVTLVRIAEDRADPAETPSTKPSSLEIYEMVTFVVKGERLEELASQEARREFVLERLRHRLPIQAPEDIERIDVTPWNIRGTVVVRIWCRISPPA
jgi:hypothetical protein